MMNYLKGMFFNRKVYIKDAKKKFDKISLLPVGSTNAIQVSVKNPKIHTAKVLLDERKVELQISDYTLNYYYENDRFMLEVHRRFLGVTGLSYEHVFCDGQMLSSAKDYLNEVVDIVLAPAPTHLSEKARNDIDAYISIFDESNDIKMLKKLILKSAKQLRFKVRDRNELERKYWNKVDDILMKKNYHAIVDWKEEPDSVRDHLAGLSRRHFDKPIQLSFEEREVYEMDELLSEFSEQIFAQGLALVSFCTGDDWMLVMLNTNEIERVKTSREELLDLGIIFFDE
ncbi:DUF6630 family protein [Aliikangiella coralliicola]|uniref:DUF6630 domain-containing protein n=1 Tax=Aliikangiella coralliicola TaxID=2592383 RepID=A0A545U8S9_9GAMM|nr:hypothetical protein [Aliikangiella coralliicola]TQV85813.1 hypothetical protein FLL46_17970 [Aliikangiella coralliicola]